MNVDRNNDLIEVIKEHFYEFSKGQKLIGQFIVDHYDKAAFMTAAKIGNTVDVSCLLYTSDAADE